MNNIKKLIRFILIYGIARTLFKVFGRLRINFIKLPSFKIKDVGLIGCGQFGFATIGFFISKKSKHTFIRAYDVDKKNQQSFENFYLIKKETASFMSIINDIEVNYVYIASNHFSHTEYALSAIKNNKIVYIEKPISVNYQQFKSFMIQNPGKTTQELCSLIQFYNFTPQTLPIAFKMFNTYKNTYFDICGPFIFKNNRWFPVYSKKYTDTIILAQENSYLRNQINQYKNQINQYKNQFN